MSHCPESNHCPTKRSHLSAEPSVPASGTDNSRSFDRESVSLSHVPNPVPQADETPHLEHKLLLVHKILFKMSHCLMYRITFSTSRLPHVARITSGHAPQVSERADDPTRVTVELLSGRKVLHR